MSQDHALTEAELAEALQKLPGWEVREGWLRKSYTTPGWSHTLLLVNTIGFVAEAAQHHPDLNVGYAQVTVKLQTHRVRGITWSDTALAQKIDEIVLWRPESGSPLSGPPKSWIKSKAPGG